MAIDGGRAHVLAFDHVLIIFVPAIFCILWYNFQLNVTNYAFSSFFSCFNLRGIILGLTKVGTKGIGRLTLCGPRMIMWTQVGEMMNGGYSDWKGSSMCG